MLHIEITERPWSWRKCACEHHAGCQWTQEWTQLSGAAAATAQNSPARNERAKGRFRKRFLHSAHVAPVKENSHTHNNQSMWMSLVAL